MNLLGQNIGQNYRGILNLGTTINSPLSTTLQSVTDGMGNNSPLQLSTTQVTITGTFSTTAVSSLSNGVLYVNTSNWANIQGRLGIGFFGDSSARLHVRGDGTNPIARFENNSGVSFFRVNQAANASLTVGDDSTANFFTLSIDGAGNANITGNSSSGKTLRVGNGGNSTTYRGAIADLTGGIYNFVGTSNWILLNTYNAFTYETGIAGAAGASSYRIKNIIYTINNSGAQTGTATGIFLNATETALNGMGHNLMDLQVGGTSTFRVNRVGNIGSLSFAISRDASTGADGNIVLTNTGGTSFGILKLGGTTNAFPAIKRNGAAIEARLADDSNYTDINAFNFNLENFGYVGSRTNSGYRISFPGTGFINHTAPNGHSFNRETIVGASSGSLNASAILQADSTTKGFLPPRMTTAQRDLIGTPAAGLMIYNTSTNRPNFYDGSAWVAL
jgi:hypothetical protein